MAPSEAGTVSSVLDQATKKVKCKVLASQTYDNNDDDDGLDENNSTNTGEGDDEEDATKVEGSESSVAVFIRNMGATAEEDKEIAAMGYNSSIWHNRRLSPTY
eukprot:1674341-Ditylum_brightwellii.AAC.1